MNDELSMVLKTIVPLAAVALVLLLLYNFLPLWLFAVVVVVTVVVGVNPKARNAIKNALAPPPEPGTEAKPAEGGEEKKS